MPVPLSDLESDVLEHAPKCPGFTVTKAIADATIEFFKDSRVKNMDLAEIPVLVDTAEYALVNPDGWQIVTPRRVDFDKKMVRPTSEEALDLDWATLSAGMVLGLCHHISGNGADEQNWRYATSDRPWLYYLIDPNHLRLVGIPTAVPTVGLNVNVVVHPAPGVTEIDDWLFNTHNPTITARALADLMARPGQPYSDPKRSAYWDEFYWDKVGQLTTAALRGHQRNDRPNLRTRVWR